MINDIITDKNVEKNLIGILKSIHEKGPISNEDFEALAYIKKYHKMLFAKYEAKLIYLLGLFYKADKPSSIIEKVYSDYAVSIEQEYKTNLTPIQASMYKGIRERKFYSFSAPTSSGKSHLFREIIQNEQGDIVITVPSRALIAEYLHEIYRLVDKTVLVLQFVENVNTKHAKRRIFVITPERSGQLFKYKEQFNITLFLMDEAQISEEEVRGLKFDAFVRRVKREFQEAKIVFSHPFISNPSAQFTKHHMESNTRAYAFTQNSVGKIYIEKDDNNKMFYFSPYDESIIGKYQADDIIETTLKNKNTILVYASKRKLLDNVYFRDYDKYLRLLPRISDEIGLKLIKQLKDYIGAEDEGSRKESTLIRFMKRGIVIHHGSMPLKARLIIENFIKTNQACVCFATSTLDQGINMPFDVVVIENFNRLDPLSLKNLIGRAGRSTKNGGFDYGYAIVNSRNRDTVINRLKQDIQISDDSKLDRELDTVDEDEYDIVEAIKSNEFNDKYNLPKAQLDRLEDSDIDKNIKFLLDTIILNDSILKGNDYYDLSDGNRSRIKKALREIYTTHLKRKQLSQAEKNVLSTALPILLWRVQGKSFKEIVSIRFHFLTEQKEQTRLKKTISDPKEADAKIEKLKIRFSQVPAHIPNKKITVHSNFEKKNVVNLQYDEVVYDTYDYLDKVISLSIVDPLYAAFSLYAERSGDNRAQDMANYIRYGTNDEKEIWLLKYGFDFEDIEWILPHVRKIDEREIVFRRSIYNHLSEERWETIKRYL